MSPDQRHQPRGTGPKWGAQWRDGAMADAYSARHPYPQETFEILGELWDGAHPACEIGAGNGRLTHGLSATVGRVDAIEPSEAMVAAAGDVGPDVRWIVTTFEDANVTGPYGLVVAAESIHWTDWSTSFSRIAAILADGAFLALVGLYGYQPGDEQPGMVPWRDQWMDLIRQSSTNDEFEPYDPLEELRRRGLFREAGRRMTARVAIAEPAEAIIERHHSMNGLSRDRLPNGGKDFDEAARAILEPHAVDGLIRTEIAAEIVWGAPE